MRITASNSLRTQVAVGLLSLSSAMFGPESTSEASEPVPRTKATSSLIKESFPTYSVKKGDNLWSVAEKLLPQYSSNREVANLVRAIIKENQLANNGNKIKVGQILHIPLSSSPPTFSPRIPNPNSNNNLVNLIVKFEGFSAKAYPDAGKWSIGFGSQYIDGQAVTANMVISKSAALEQLRLDLARISKSVDSLVEVKLTQAQENALVCLVYNIGEGAFRSSQLLKAINRQDWTATQREWLRWSNSQGIRLASLAKRRNSEVKLFLSGVKADPPDSKPATLGL